MCKSGCRLVAHFVLARPRTHAARQFSPFLQAAATHYLLRSAFAPALWTSPRPDANGFSVLARSVTWKSQVIRVCVVDCGLLLLLCLFLKRRHRLDKTFNSSRTILQAPAGQPMFTESFVIGQQCTLAEFLEHVPRTRAGVVHDPPKSAGVLFLDRLCVREHPARVQLGVVLRDTHPLAVLAVLQRSFAGPPPVDWNNFWAHFTTSACQCPPCIAAHGKNIELDLGSLPTHTLADGVLLADSTLLILLQCSWRYTEYWRPTATSPALCDLLAEDTPSLLCIWLPTCLVACCATEDWSSPLTDMNSPPVITSASTTPSLVILPGTRD
ncbi:hypothetical protein HPB50_011035 [Hyalomma asiaticum]|uniref:Uncharacterized protein n=1 Tax=Hyalomma asiaticum TaxID=266040 RepID=A0ACB7RP30_HYAAI|nr:hypothetical protein HPB50_011035 [Hyalomma asiaticum]